MTGRRRRRADHDTGISPKHGPDGIGGPPAISPKVEAGNPGALPCERLGVVPAEGYFDVGAPVTSL
ncbi:hypothetical protein GCM10009715_21220 [Paeniglutamicibacter psychrophenolicus]